MKKIILASLLAFGLTASAIASEDGSGAYVGLAYGNTAFSADDDNSVNKLKDDKDSGFKVYGGYQFNKIVGIEAVYTDYGEFTYTNTKLSASAVSIGANLGYNFLDGQLRPYALVGLSYLTLDQDGRALYDGDNTVSYTYGVGIEYSPKVLNGVGFRAAWNTDIYIVDSSTISGGDDYSAQGFGLFSVAVQYKF